MACVSETICVWYHRTGLSLIVTLHCTVMSSRSIMPRAYGSFSSALQMRNIDIMLIHGLRPLLVEISRCW
jgi:hypothetical protein